MRDKDTRSYDFEGEEREGWEREQQVTRFYSRRNLLRLGPDLFFLLVLLTCSTWLILGSGWAFYLLLGVSTLIGMAVVGMCAYRARGSIMSTQLGSTPSRLLLASFNAARGLYGISLKFRFFINTLYIAIVFGFLEDSSNQLKLLALLASVNIVWIFDLLFITAPERIRLQIPHRFRASNWKTFSHLQVSAKKIFLGIINLILSVKAFWINVYLTVLGPFGRKKQWRQASDIQIDAHEENSDRNEVETHWSRHTIKNWHIHNKSTSLNYIKEMDLMYPYYFDYCNLYGDHTGESIMDYGCGPGNDLAGFVHYSNAKEIIGVDISIKALTESRMRLALHGKEKSKVQLFKISEKSSSIPMPDNSIDYLQCLGVLHHTTEPDKVLKEFYRVIKPGGSGKIMVYNLESLYINLTIPYEQQILRGQYPGLTAYEAYQEFGDSGAPICLAYTPEEFRLMLRKAGFLSEYVGAAFSVTELESYDKYFRDALAHNDLPLEHREFLSNVTISEMGHPLFNGYNAGLDAIFDIRK